MQSLLSSAETAGATQAAERALDWLLRRIGSDGIAPTDQCRDGCPSLAGAALQIAVHFGQLQAAAQLTAWLRDLQRADGSFPDACQKQASLWNTAGAIRGLLAIAPVDTQAARSAERALDFLRSRIDERGRLAVDHGWGFERWAPDALHLACVPALVEGARYCNRADLERAAHALLARRLPGLMPAIWSLLLDQAAHCVEGVLALRQGDLARRLGGVARANQTRGGAVAARAGATWVSTAGLAHLASLWYRLGWRDSADRALAWLRRRQLPGGGFVGSIGRGACYYAGRESAWTACRFLEAARLQVRAAFDDAVDALPRAISQRDGRVVELARHLARLPRGARVVDVGCGSGRYIASLAERFPTLRFTGIDAAAPLVARLPAHCQGCVGDLLSTTPMDVAFDAVYAVEVIEHTLTPRQAIHNLCRMARPGGLVVVIDKNRAFQSRSRHQPWERWFSREEMATWLAADCEQVRCHEIAHGQSERPSGLFLCWTAIRRGAAGALAAAA
jgi:SAM-dependent methyltransferase